MLDNETNNEASTTGETSPTPPRRRRTASRPAGPPKQIEPARTPVRLALDAPEVIPPLPALEPPAASAEPEPKKPARRRSTKISEPVVAEGTKPAAEAEPSIAPITETKPKRSRRRKKDESVPEPTPTLLEEETPVVEPVSDQAQSDEDEEKDELAEALAAIEVSIKALPEDVDPDDVPLEDDRDAILNSLAEAIASNDDDALESDLSGEESEASADDSAEQLDGDETPKRRRRRGGRRRRRSNRAEDETETDSEEESETAEGTDTSEGEEEPKTTTRRRRRRRRRGEDASGEDEPGTDVIVKVRDPRRGLSDSDQVTGIEGSTRLEAKRQRRKESRAAGRRRAPILSEAEFLARRESVDRKLVIRQREDYTQLAVLEDNVLVEHYVDRASATSLIGSIYLGKVQNVLPSMEAAFIDIGRGRNAVLYAGEIDWDGLGHTGERKVEAVFKSGQSVLVQVSKDPIGAKGARLTSHISLPGRYIVYSPGGHLSGISRKLPDVERARLKEILSSLIGEEASVIVRTAAEGVNEDELIRDVNRLKAQWEVIEKKSKQGSAPQQLYCEPDLTLRIVRDLFTEDFNEMIVQGDGSGEDAYDAISAYVSHIAPHLAERVRRYEPVEGSDCFTNFRIDEQIAKALERKVFLPSGGSLIIDRTEAMTVIDVNTGKFTGTGGNLEATVTSNNLEAAEEIVRQLRLRDIGGIIVVDFIDMVLPSNRELLLRRLVECLGRDRTRHQVAEVTSLGLVQLTRKKIGTGLAEAFTETCDCCKGRGYHRFQEPVDSQAPADGGERPGKRRRRNGNH